MAYTHRFYVVKKTKSFGIDETENLRYAYVLARFDMGRNDLLGKKLDKYSATDCFIYMDDGDTPLIEDDYGEKLKEISVIDLLYILNPYVPKNVLDEYEITIYQAFYDYLTRLNRRMTNSTALKDIVVLHCGT